MEKILVIILFLTSVFSFAEGSQDLKAEFNKNYFHGEQMLEWREKYKLGDLVPLKKDENGIILPLYTKKVDIRPPSFGFAPKSIGIGKYLNEAEISLLPKHIIDAIEGHYGCEQYTKCSYTVVAMSEAYPIATTYQYADEGICFITFVYNAESKVLNSRVSDTSKIDPYGDISLAQEGEGYNSEGYNIFQAVSENAKINEYVNIPALSSLIVIFIKDKNGNFVIKDVSAAG